jgi:hypothetical protein
MAIYGGPDIITDGLVFHVDAANTKSYPGNGDEWYDLINNNIGYIGNNSVHSIDYYNSSYAPTFTNDGYGSFLFDGSNDQVVFPDSPSLRYIGSNISLFTWAKPTQTVSTFRNILARRNSSNIGGYIHHNSGSDSLLVYVYNNMWRSTSLSNVFQANVWSCTGFTFDGTSLKIYKNGILVGNNANAGGGAINPVESTMRIGGNGGTSQHWLGYISNVQIYNSTLTDNQILQNYNTLKGRYGL